MAFPKNEQEGGRRVRRRLGRLAACTALAGALAGGLLTGVAGANPHSEALAAKHHKNGHHKHHAKHHHKKLTKITIGVVPFYMYAATYLGEKKGIFAHYGLKVVLKTASNITPIIFAEMHSNEVQLGFASTALMVNAVEKGQNTRCVAPVMNKNVSTPHFPETAIMVAKNSSIHSLKQLDGKTVALNDLSGSNHLFLEAALENAGGTFKTVKLTAVPFADMAAALKSGSITAAFEVPPFIKVGENEGDQKLLARATTVATGLTTTCYMATNTYISSHKHILQRFVKAQDQSILFGKAHPNEVRAEVPAVSGLTASQAKGSVPPNLVFSDKLKAHSIVKYEKLMSKYTTLDGPVQPVKKVAWLPKVRAMKKLEFNGAGKFIGRGKHHKKS